MLIPTLNIEFSESVGTPTVTESDFSPLTHLKSFIFRRDRMELGKNKGKIADFSGEFSNFHNRLICNDYFDLSAMSLEICVAQISAAASFSSAQSWR